MATARPKRLVPRAAGHGTDARGPLRASAHLLPGGARALSRAAAPPLSLGARAAQLPGSCTGLRHSRRQAAVLACAAVTALATSDARREHAGVTPAGLHPAVCRRDTVRPRRAHPHERSRPRLCVRAARALITSPNKDPSLGALPLFPPK